MDICTYPRCKRIRDLEDTLERTAQELKIAHGRIATLEQDVKRIQKSNREYRRDWAELKKKVNKR